MPAPISLLTTYDKQCDDMVELYRSGKTQKEIGDIYGLPRRSVMKILARLGVHKSHADAQKSRFDPGFVEFVLKHRSKGKSIEEIAFNAGRSASAVHRVLQRKNDNKPSCSCWKM